MKELASFFDDDAGHDKYPELDHVMGDSSSQGSVGPPLAKPSKNEPKVIKVIEEETKNGHNQDQANKCDFAVDNEYGSEENQSNLSCDSKYQSDSDSDESMMLNGKKFSVTKTSKSGMYDFTFLKDAEFLAKSAEEQ